MPIGASSSQIAKPVRKSVIVSLVRFCGGGSTVEANGERALEQVMLAYIQAIRYMDTLGRRPSNRNSKRPNGEEDAKTKVSE